MNLNLILSKYTTSYRTACGQKPHPSFMAVPVEYIEPLRRFKINKIIVIVMYVLICRGLLMQRKQVDNSISTSTLLLHKKFIEGRVPLKFIRHSLQLVDPCNIHNYFS